MDALFYAQMNHSQLCSTVYSSIEDDLVGLLHFFNRELMFWIQFYSNHLQYCFEPMSFITIYMYYNTKIEIWTKLKTLLRVVIETMNLPWNPFIVRGKT